jgi:hypothetical protein
MKHIACLGIGVTLSFNLLVLAAAAQSSAPQDQAQSASSTSSSSTSTSQSSSSQSSLGDYARQIKKAGPAAKPKVFDNDNLPTEDKLSIVGSAPTADNSNNNAKAETSASTSGAGSSEAKAGETKPASNLSPEGEQAAKEALWKQWGDKVAAQKDQIDLLGRELSVLQREYQLRAAAMYGDAGNRLRNEADWDKQDAQYKQQIADKQKALDDAKQKLEDMQEEARKAGVPSSFLGE